MWWLRCSHCLGSHPVLTAVNQGKKGKRSWLLKKGALWTFLLFIFLLEHLLHAAVKSRGWGQRDDCFDSEEQHLKSYPSLVTSSPSWYNPDSARICGLSCSEITQHQYQGMHHYQQEVVQQQWALILRGKLIIELIWGGYKTSSFCRYKHYKIKRKINH